MIPKASVSAIAQSGGSPLSPISPVSRKKLGLSLAILLVLIFSKYFYMASMTSYYIFYLMDKFHLSVQNAQIHLFIFLFSVAAGTLIGGPVGDRIGREICDLVLYPGRGAFHPATAV